MSIALSWLGRAGLFARRFVLEVLASAIVTACVTAATTTYLRYRDEPPPPPKGIEIGDLMSPVADMGASHFVALKQGAHSVSTIGAIEVPIALPPPRPKIAAAPLKRPQPAPAQAVTPRPEPAALQFVDALTESPDMTGERSQNVAPSAPPPARAERTVLGIMVPDLMPTGDDVLKGVRSLGDAAKGLVP